MRKYINLILVFIVLLASASIANASLSLVKKNIPVEMIPIDSDYGMIEPGYNRETGLFTHLNYWVKATGAISGTRYRTTRIWLEIDGHTLWFDTPELAEWSPPPGQTLAAAVRIGMDDIFIQMIETIPGINTREEAEEEFYWSDKSLKIGPEIEVFNVATGEAISERQHTSGLIENLLRSNGFDDVHINDVLDRFQEFPIKNYHITVSHNLVREHPAGEIEYNGKKYEYVEQLGYDYLKVDNGTSKTFHSMEDPSYEYLVAAYEGMGRVPFEKIFIEDPEVTVTTTKEHNVISVNFYYVAKELPDFEIVSLSPGTEATEPGTFYTGTITYCLKNTVQSPVEAKLQLTHNGFSLKTPSGEAIYNKTVTFQPGESKTFQFVWTGLQSESTIRAEIWPTTGEDAAPSDNVREVIVPRAVKTNLSVRITEHPAKAREGQAVHVVALVESNSDELIHTNIEWKVNGVRHHYSDDLIFKNSREATITFTMPTGEASVELVVNQNNDRPAEEDITDNTATATVQFEPDLIDEHSEFWLSIDAPDEIPSSLLKDRRPFEYTVNVHWDWKQERFWDGFRYQKAAPPTRTITLDVVTRGQFSRNFNIDTRQAYNIIINDDRYNQTFSMRAIGGPAGSINTSTKSFTFSYPQDYPATNYGIFERDEYAIIKASIDAGASTEKKVIVREIPVGDWGPQLIK